MRLSISRLAAIAMTLSILAAGAIALGVAASAQGEPGDGGNNPGGGNQPGTKRTEGSIRIGCGAKEELGVKQYDGWAIISFERNADGRVDTITHVTYKLDTYKAGTTEQLDEPRSTAQIGLTDQGRDTGDGSKVVVKFPETGDRLQDGAVVFPETGDRLQDGADHDLVTQPYDRAFEGATELIDVRFSFAADGLASCTAKLWL